MGKNKLFTSEEEIFLFESGYEDLRSQRVFAPEDFSIPARTECVVQRKFEECGGYSFNVADFADQSDIHKEVSVEASVVGLS